MTRFIENKFVYLEELREPSKLFSSSSDCSIRLWDLKSGDCIKTFTGHNFPVTCIKNAFNTKLISGDEKGFINIWSIYHGNLLRSIKAYDNTILKIKLVSENRFVTCSYDRELKLYDLNTFDCIKDLYCHTSNPSDFIQTRDNIIVSCHPEDFKLVGWQLEEEKKFYLNKNTFQINNLSDFQFKSREKIYNNCNEAPYILFFSKEYFITCSHDEIQVHDHGGELLYKLIVKKRYVNTIIQLSKDKIVSGEDSGIITIWDISDGIKEKQINSIGKPIRCLIRLSNNKIISCSDDTTIKIWDTDTNTCLKTFVGHTKRVSCLDLFYD